jgi:hypothetical protein
MIMPEIRADRPYWRGLTRAGPPDQRLRWTPKQRADGDGRCAYVPVRTCRPIRRGRCDWPWRTRGRVTSPGSRRRSVAQPLRQPRHWGRRGRAADPCICLAPSMKYPSGQLLPGCNMNARARGGFLPSDLLRVSHLEVVSQGAHPPVEEAPPAQCTDLAQYTPAR